MTGLHTEREVRQCGVLGYIPVFACAGTGRNLWCQDIQAVVLGQV